MFSRFLDKNRSKSRLKKNRGEDSQKEYKVKDLLKVAGDTNWENGDVPVCCNCFIYETRIDDLFVIS